MPRVTLETIEDIQDFVRGAAFYGTGGGGSVENGIQVLSNCLEKALPIGWVDADEIPDELFTCSPFGMGSIAPKTQAALDEQKSFGLTVPQYERGPHFVRAIEELEREVGRKIDVLVPIELGGGNSATCIAAAALSGKMVVDGDYTGRAIPAIYQTTPYVHGFELLPLTSCDFWGNVCAIRAATSWKMAERIGKMLSVAGFTGCGMAGFALRADHMKKALVHGTLTDCLNVGRSIRQAREKGLDPVEAGAKGIGGKVVMRGIVSKKDWWDKDGYLWGWNTIVSEEDGDTQEIRIFYQNENHLCYRNGKVLATSPDMIILADEFGEPLTNTVVDEGQRVAVVLAPGRAIFRTKRGLEVLGPQNFGADTPYVEVEQLY